MEKLRIDPEMIFESVPMALCLCDSTWAVRRANRAFCEMAGDDVESLLGRRLCSAKESPADGDILACGAPRRCAGCVLHEAIASVVASGKERRGVEVKVPSRVAGTEIDSRLLATVTPAEVDGSNGFLLSLQDLSEFHRRDSLARTLAQAVEQSPVTTVITDLAGTIEYVNPKFVASTGFTAAEAIGQNPRIVSSGEQPKSIYRDMWETIEAGRTWTGLFHNRKKSGELYWEEAIISPVKDAEGRILRFLALKQDVTERKRMEELLRLQAAAMDTTLGFIVIADARLPDTPIIYANAAFSRVTGYSRDEIIGRNPRFLHGDDTSQTGLAEIRAGVRVKRACQALIRNYRKDGTPFWNEIYISPVRNEAGEVTHFLGISNDVTERKLAELEILRSREEALQATKVKSEFLSSMSHELRTPMNAILGFGQLLERDPALGEAQLDFIREIMRAGHHLLDLINEVLDLSKIESGRIELSLETVSCPALVDEAMSLIAPLADKRGIRMKKELAGSPSAIADPMRLKQVLVNLLSNAVKYNRDGGLVTISLAGRGPMARFEIEDTGYGIPPEKMGQLFTPFNRLGRDSSDIEGSGIGLLISKRLVELMGGHIGAASAEGKGSRFWVEIPLDRQMRESGADSRITPAHPDFSTWEPRNKRRSVVLYIEDNPANLRLMDSIFATRDDVRLLTAPGASIGLELAEAYRPALILLDLNMPEADGYEILRRIRATDWGSRLPVVAVTALAMTRDIERGMEAGFADYLTKPIDVQRLLKTVDRLLGERPDDSAKEDKTWTAS